MSLLALQEIKSLTSLYMLQMRQLLSAQNQLSSGLEGMMDAAADQQLKYAFRSHLQETGPQRERIEQIVIELTGAAEEAKCSVTAALLASAEKIVKASEAGPLRDAWLAASAHRIENFAIASYQSALQWASLLGYPYHVSLLEKTLQEEQHANSLIGGIAERINSAAKAA